MNKINSAVMVCTGIFLASQILSCTKPPANIDPRDGNNTYSGCRIAQTVNGNTSRQFVYNSNNDPVSVQASFVGTGSPNLRFTYNKKDQLIEYAGLYSNGSFEFLHRYGYSNNRLITDTTYTLGPYANPANSFSKRYSYVAYDALHRVVQDSEIHVYPLPRTEVHRYQYNASGNLETSPGNIYDTNLNPHRTNKVWMLIDRNYSVNNPVTAENYNSSGLPLTLQGGGKTSLVMILGYFYYYSTTQIIYDCR